MPFKTQNSAFSKDLDANFNSMREHFLWKELWDVKCRQVKLKGILYIVMPFCFSIRIRDGTPTFCGLEDWTRSSLKDIDQAEVKEYANIDCKAFNRFANNPQEAAKIALKKMLEKGYQHDDIKWPHVALLPRFSNHSEVVQLDPILIDLSRVKSPPESDIDSLMTLFN